MTDDPSTYLTNGAWYRIQGPNNLVLCDKNGLNLRYAGITMDTDCWQVWWHDERGWCFENWTSGRRIWATEPPRPDGGPPMGQPPRGAPVYAADGPDERRYTLWVLYPQALSHKYAVQAYQCYDLDTAMFLNVKGDEDQWKELDSELITWEWSRGKPNEIWWFQEIDPQPDPATREIRPSA